MGTTVDHNPKMCYNVGKADQIQANEIFLWVVVRNGEGTNAKDLTNSIRKDVSFPLN